MQRILVVEDEADLRKVLATLLGRGGYTVDLVEDGIQACDKLGREIYDLIITDLRLPGADGMQVLRASKTADPDLPVIIITAYSTDEAAEEARRLGAFNYILKPFDTDKILADVSIALGWKRLGSLVSTMEGKQGLDRIVGRSEKMKGILELVGQVAPTGSTVLITGESGTGKELIARAIHFNSSRRDNPFVAVNCGAIPPNLLESELFGHVRGSFTDAIRDKKGLFEQAHTGTLFLDEIGELPLALQVKLLRALQDQEIRKVGANQAIKVDVRILAATVKDVAREVRENRFREDLYYRLNVLAVHLPPLRERPGDIPILIDHFFEKHCAKHGLRKPALSKSAQRMLIDYRWPGNVRELENVIERTVILSGETVSPSDLPPALLEPTNRVDSVGALGENALSLKHRVRALEEVLIRQALEVSQRNRTHAAKLLDISHRTLLYKMTEYGIK